MDMKIARTAAPRTHVSPAVKRDEMHRGDFTSGQFERRLGHVTEEPHPSDVSKAIRQKRERKGARKEGVG